MNDGMKGRVSKKWDDIIQNQNHDGVNNNIMETYLRDLLRL